MSLQAGNFERLVRHYFETVQRDAYVQHRMAGSFKRSQFIDKVLSCVVKIDKSLTSIADHQVYLDTGQCLDVIDFMARLYPVPAASGSGAADDEDDDVMADVDADFQVRCVSACLLYDGHVLA